MNVSVKRYSDSSNVHSIKVDEHAVECRLWESFKTGDRDALNRIFENYARQLFVYARKITSDHGLISDCIQDLFVELWLKRDTLTSEIRSIRFYLLKSIRRRILRRMCADDRIIGKPIPDGYSLLVQSHIESQLIDHQSSSEISSSVKKSLAFLSEGQREAVYLKFYENLSYDEIASIMNTNVKAVYNLISKSIISLRRVLQNDPILKDF